MSNDSHKNSSTERGQEGERLASQYLSRQGFRILEKNWKSRRGEVDLIAQRKECLFFVEVKLRQSQGFGSALESIPPSKQRKMVSAALDYIQRRRIQEKDFKLAALLIDREESGFRVEFFEFPLDLPHKYY
jgi:putative endonuclease